MEGRSEFKMQSQALSTNEVMQRIDSRDFLIMLFARKSVIELNAKQIAQLRNYFKKTKEFLKDFLITKDDKTQFKLSEYVYLKLTSFIFFYALINPKEDAAKSTYISAITEELLEEINFFHQLIHEAPSPQKDLEIFQKKINSALRISHKDASTIINIIENLLVKEKNEQRIKENYLKKVFSILRSKENSSLLTEIEDRLSTNPLYLPIPIVNLINKSHSDIAGKISHRLTVIESYRDKERNNKIFFVVLGFGALMTFFILIGLVKLLKEAYLKELSQKGPSDNSCKSNSDEMVDLLYKTFLFVSGSLLFMLPYYFILQHTLLMQETLEKNSRPEPIKDDYNSLRRAIKNAFGFPNTVNYQITINKTLIEQPKNTSSIEVFPISVVENGIPKKKKTSKGKEVSEEKRSPIQTEENVTFKYQLKGQFKEGEKYFIVVNGPKITVYTYSGILYGQECIDKGIDVNNVLDRGTVRSSGSDGGGFGGIKHLNGGKGQVKSAELKVDKTRDVFIKDPNNCVSIVRFSLIQKPDGSSEVIGRTEISAPVYAHTSSIRK